MTELTDTMIIEEAVRMTREGLAVTFLVKGRSMLPFIYGGIDSVILTAPGKVKKGDAVLARIGKDHYVLHRIVGIDGDKVELMGDGNIAGRETCRISDILARADEVVGADGRHERLEASSRFAIRLWMRLRPVRRWLLAIYKRTIIRNIPVQ